VGGAAVAGVQIWMEAAEYRVPGGSLVVRAPMRLASDGRARVVGRVRLERFVDGGLDGASERGGSEELEAGGEVAGLEIQQGDDGGVGGGAPAVVVASGVWELTGSVVYGGEGAGDSEGAVPAVLVCSGATCHIRHCKFRVPVCSAHAPRARG